MLINLDDLLPSDINDESAYIIINFINELLSLIESRYYPKAHRYIADQEKQLPWSDVPDNTLL